jgi:hypothetical protein
MEVFTTAVAPLVQDALHGRDGMLATLGVTGSGKSHTILGNKSQRGMTQLALDLVFSSLENKIVDYNRLDMSNYDYSEALVYTAAGYFQQLQKAIDAGFSAGNRPPAPMTTPDEPLLGGMVGQIDEKSVYAVIVSMYELYNDRIFDLLDETAFINPGARRRALVFRAASAPSWDPMGTTKQEPKKVVAGLRKVACRTYSEALMVLEHAQRSRKVSATGSNSVSSRSHAFLQIEIKRFTPRGAERESSSLQIVDLAGAERSKNAGTSGDQLAEAGSINRSLMTLGQCLEAQQMMRQGKGNTANWRSSKLTEVLFANSFSGVSRQRAVMCVTADPGGDYNSTVQILRYSAMAREVQVLRQASIKIPEPEEDYEPEVEEEIPQTARTAMLQQDSDPADYTGGSRIPSGLPRLAGLPRLDCTAKISSPRLRAATIGSRFGSPRIGGPTKEPETPASPKIGYPIPETPRIPEMPHLRSSQQIPETLRMRSSQQVALESATPQIPKTSRYAPVSERPPTSYVSSFTEPDPEPEQEPETYHRPPTSYISSSTVPRQSELEPPTPSLAIPDPRDALISHLLAELQASQQLCRDLEERCNNIEHSVRTEMADEMDHQLDMLRKAFDNERRKEKIASRNFVDEKLEILKRGMEAEFECYPCSCSLSNADGADGDALDVRVEQYEAEIQSQAQRITELEEDKTDILSVIHDLQTAREEDLEHVRDLEEENDTLRRELDSIRRDMRGRSPVKRVITAPDGGQAGQRRANMGVKMNMGMGRIPTLGSGIPGLSMAMPLGRPGTAGSIGSIGGGMGIAGMGGYGGQRISVGGDREPGY